MWQAASARPKSADESQTKVRGLVPFSLHTELLCQSGSAEQYHSVSRSLWGLCAPQMNPCLNKTSTLTSSWQTWERLQMMYCRIIPCFVYSDSAELTVCSEERYLLHHNLSGCLIIPDSNPVWVPLMLPFNPVFRWKWWLMLVWKVCRGLCRQVCCCLLPRTHLFLYRRKVSRRFLELPRKAAWERTKVQFLWLRFGL